MGKIGKMRKLGNLTPRSSETVRRTNKKLSCRRERARFLSLNILLSHSSVNSK